MLRQSDMFFHYFSLQKQLMTEARLPTLHYFAWSGYFFFFSHMLRQSDMFFLFLLLQKQLMTKARLFTLHCFAWSAYRAGPRTA